ncbi:hypothetical protein [Sphingomonas panaciterrae]|uniref:hypothetical protein n=1 Tax=Sphingomonas panaciterrae TaxID=1462999 RepID=UPI002FEEFE2B
MAKNNGPKRNPGIMVGFDKAALRRHVEDADRRRAPTQEELATAYGTDSDIIAHARAFPASVDDVIEGICAQDQRFLDQGRKLLKQLLRSNARLEPDTGRKRRGRSARRSNAVSTAASSRGGNVALEHGSAPVAPQRPTAPVSAPLFDDSDYGDADAYGG